MEGSLSGQLLIAAPQLSDYFRRTVVLVLAHDGEGAMGLVLNRPTDTPVTEAVPELRRYVDEEQVLHAGGPVQPDAVLVVREREGEPELVAVEEIDDGEGEIAVFAGYAGWAPGQLDAEVDAAAWITAPAEEGDAFSSEDLWADVLQRKGGPYELMTTLPADPSLN